MAARGMAPLPPADLVVAQFVLTFDPDEKIQAAAKTGLEKLDDRIANAVLSKTDIPGPVLGHLALLHAKRDDWIESLLLNPSTPTHAFLAVAEQCSEAISELIANNQARLLKQPEIARALLANPSTLKSTGERVVDFLVRNGVMLEGLRDFDDALLRLDHKARVEAVQSIDIPPEMLDQRFLDSGDDAEEHGERRLIEEDEEADEAPQTIEAKLRVANVAEKVAYATKGNKSVRSILMRDTNRIVALAAITSPAITEPEVIAAAQSRNVHADIIGHICRDKKSNWTRIYAVKLALVSNPKTPLPDAMKMTPLLNKRDLRLLSKSKNIPAGVRVLATKLAKAAQGGH